MSDEQLRHRCRNPRCRMKLPQPVENEHHAFCCRGCFERFYFNKCRVCEHDLRKQGRRGDAHRLYCRPPRDCRSEAQKWPAKYEYGPRARISTTNARNADSTGLKIGIRGTPPPFNCLRHWVWGGDPENGDHSLYNQDSLTVARIVLADGRYHLRSPLAWPCQSWPDLDEAKRHSEAITLSALPLDSKLAASNRRNNDTPHPMRRKLPAIAG
jgi:hypothetical protein